MLGFVIRLIGYALLLGLSAQVANALWSHHGLDAIGALRSFHDKATLLLYVAAIVLALIGFGRLRAPAIFIGFFLAGAALTAPFAIARVVGALPV
jgi:hypothetical protein